MGPAQPTETRYRVHRADGSHADEVIEHVRLDMPAGDKRVWWERDGQKSLRGLGTSALSLHGIDERFVLEAQRVVVTEGEKAAASLRERGIAAVGTVTGAGGTPGQEALAALAGRDVVLWPDADEPGRKHMDRVVAGLEGVARPSSAERTSRRGSTATSAVKRSSACWRTHSTGCLT